MADKPKGGSMPALTPAQIKKLAEGSKAKPYRPRPLTPAQIRKLERPAKARFKGRNNG